MVREDVVNRLVNVALDVMSDHSKAGFEFTPDEFYSACFTLAGRGAASALQHGADPARLQSAVGLILLRCVDERTKH